MKQLGKKVARHDPRTFRLTKYLEPLPLPPEISWHMEIPKWPMYMNDTVGDCVPASSGHMVHQWTHYAGPEFVPRDGDILRAYEIVGDYNPNDPSTDNGADMLTMLKYWRKIGIVGHKIKAFVSIDLRNTDEIKRAVWLFGNAYVGLQLPASVQDKNKWTVPDGGIYTDDGSVGSWGGHCVPVMATSSKTLTCITWGERLKMSWNFYYNYADEAYAVLSEDWIARTGFARNGFNMTALLADLAAL